MIYLQLFWSFIQVGLFSVGGGYAALPIIQSQVVDHFQWLTLKEFTDLIVIAEMTPGPIAINSATIVGIRLAGIWGAVVATLGCVLPSLVTVTLLSWLYMRYRHANGMQTVLSSLRPAVVALITSAAITMSAAVIFPQAEQTLQSVDWIGVAFMVVAFLMLRKFKWAPIPVMLGCGGVYLLVSMALGTVS